MVVGTFNDSMVIIIIVIIILIIIIIILLPHRFSDGFRNHFGP